MPGVGEEGAFDRDGLAVVLVGPSGVVAVAADRQLEVGVERGRVRFAVVLKVGRFQRLVQTSLAGKPSLRH